MYSDISEKAKCSIQAALETDITEGVNSDEDIAPKPEQKSAASSTDEMLIDLTAAAEPPIVCQQPSQPQQVRHFDRPFKGPYYRIVSRIVLYFSNPGSVLYNDSVFRNVRHGHGHASRPKQQLQAAAAHWIVGTVVGLAYRVWHGVRFKGRARQDGPGGPRPF